MLFFLHHLAELSVSERASPDIFVIMSYLYTRVIRTPDEVTKDFGVLCKTKNCAVTILVSDGVFSCGCGIAHLRI